MRRAGREQRRDWGGPARAPGRSEALLLPFIRALLVQPDPHYWLLEIATLWPAEPHLGEKCPEECSCLPCRHTSQSKDGAANHLSECPLCRKMFRPIYLHYFVFASHLPPCTQFTVCTFHTFQSHWSGAK